MTFKVWLAMIIVMGFMGLMEGVASATASGVGADVEAGFQGISSAKVVQIDDAELDSGPLNIDFSFGLVFDRSVWGKIFQMFMWDYSWFVGDLNVVRWIGFGTFTTVTAILFVTSVGTTLMGAIRGRG